MKKETLSFNNEDAWNVASTSSIQKEINELSLYTHF